MSKLKYYSKTEYNNKERSWITKTYIYISCADLSPLIEEAAINILHSVYNRIRNGHQTLSLITKIILVYVYIKKLLKALLWVLML